MSAAVVESESDTIMLCCASCGIAGGDDMKLKKCTACHLVKYCSVKCQKDHRPQHKRECKKRAAELRDEILFKQPESSHFGDCPICCLPLPIDKSKSSMFSCCSKFICNGCVHANNKREYEGRLQPSCPFCREATPSTCEKINEQWMKRIEANDPVAICDMGTKKYHEKDYKNAYEHWTRAIALGDVEAHYQLSCLYRDGLGVEKDMKKRVYHLEQAAIGGYLMARHNLGCVELDNGQHGRAVKHWIIAAKLGFEPSLENVKNSYTYGHVSKDDLAAALRGHQAAIDATKSPQREEAVKFAAGV
eukprot:scaffold3310_cov87-Skeletonema_menzelii.AAC.5